MQIVATPATAGPADDKRESDTLFHEGYELMQEGRFPEACTKFERSLALVVRGGTLHNLAICRELTGELATALQLFEEDLKLALQDNKQERVIMARTRIVELTEKVAWITVTLAPGNEAPGLTVSRDGVVLPREKWSTPVPVDPGTHTVSASAPGFVTFQTSVTVSLAKAKATVEIPALAPLPPQPRPVPELLPKPPGADANTGSPALAKTPDAVHPDWLSHHLQPGITVRVDIDPIARGARTAPGLSLGLGDHFELGASALLGPEMGFEPQITTFLLGATAFKPLINVAVPVFFVEGPSVGLRAAAGVAWDFMPHLGAFAHTGGVYFPTPARTDAWNYQHAMFLTTVGVQGRL